ncbi:hypothetical protein CROQUDRAFT_41826 [Cronartium quercuum f. sp. fusiforme G11]|uniref:RNA-binding protein VTS1 n=1 Tax=Cronartium quercuum f. sp. fusiforme G11 TaxID=708437 RepID=A0A9P6NQ43_9BASI|nr:hypothetical protein CROQUDRAFT_41826 [Cronartium quercuum f. sp. fusiforme G11]
MTSLAPIRPPSSNSNRSSTPVTNNNNSNPNGVFRHQHSLSTSTPGVNQHFGQLSPHYGGARSAGGPRQSLDASKALATSGPISPRIGSGNHIRPNSEMLGLGGQQIFGPSLEAEAIDKWFEDLQSYEATLEEMAAASLDVNFKEELSAIEQWFRVLSEAERTAALYSLLQSSTQVQIRFFITVLQQMARSDPMTALLSPAPSGGAASMEQQMEAKLAQLSMKSPASPVVRQFARQSLGATNNNPPASATAESYLSPNSALLNESTNSSNDAAILLANQRAKLQKASAANRVSAPVQLLGDNNSLKSPKWNNHSGTVNEEEFHNGRSSSPRPKSTGSDLTTSQLNSHSNSNNFNRNPSNGTGLESQLSPIGVGGSWASQVNTPLVPMFANKEEGSQAESIAEVNNRLANWGAAHQASGSNQSSPVRTQAPNSANHDGSSPTSGIQLDDARKFRRQSKGLQGGVSTSSFSGVLSGLGPSANGGHNSNSNSQSAQPNSMNSSLSLSTNSNNPTGQSFNRSGAGQLSNSFGGPRSALHANNVGGGMPSPISTQSLLNAQQAAMAAQQNWRNGLNSPGIQNVGNDPTMVNNLAMMNTLAGFNGGMNINGMANMAAMANMSDPNALQNMANLLNMQQQMQQAQHLQALQQQMQQSGMMGGMLGANGTMLSPLSARLGMNFPAGFPMMGAGTSTAGGTNNKRSPGAGRSPIGGKPTHTPGSGSNPDEELDMKLLSDIPSWLRGLRLHKYTPNFEGCTWQEMVLMSDSDLETRGVAAVGARRKMLRTFENVRIKKGMALPGDGEKKENENNNNDGENKEVNVTNTTPTPESDMAH